jgi:uncharacterized protein (DUF362 family)
MNTVSFVRSDSQNENDVKNAIRESLEMIGFSIPTDIRQIVIKPNLCYYYHSSTGETTDPVFIGCLIDVFREVAPPNVDIFVVESDASAMKCDLAFKLLGYNELAEKKSIKLLNLSKWKQKTST